MGERNESDNSECPFQPNIPVKLAGGGNHFKTCRLAQLAKNLGVSLIFY